MQTETSKALSTQLKPQSSEIRAWIKKELGLLAIRFGQPMTAERLTLYAEDLQGFPQFRLRIAFDRLKREWTAGDFGFPLPADITDRMTSAPGQVQEYQGITEAQKRQWKAEYDEGEANGENAKLREQLKAIWEKCTMWSGQKRKVKLPEIKAMPIREMTDMEFEQRKQQLRQQAEIAQRMCEKQW